MDAKGSRDASSLIIVLDLEAAVSQTGRRVCHLSPLWELQEPTPERCTTRETINEIALAYSTSHPLVLHSQATTLFN